MNTYNYLVDKMEYEPLSKMTRMKYQSFINEYADAPHTKASVQKMHIQISSAISDALEDGLIEKDFTQKVNIYGGKGINPDDKFLELEDTDRLMDYLEFSEDLYDISPAMIYTALFTGMRLS